MKRILLRGRGAPLRALLAFFLSLPLAVLAAGDPDSSPWRDVSETAVARTAAQRQIVPVEYRTVRLDLAAFERRMALVPQERNTQLRESQTRLDLPMPDGTLAGFHIVESPVMAPELAKKFPQIRTWVGQGIDDPTATLRFDLTHKGFHAQVLSASGTTYIDPFQPGDREHYISYRKEHHHHGEEIRCSVTGEPLSKESVHDHLAHSHAKVSSGGSLRTYRLAVTTTGEYTAFHGGGVADALAGIVTTINRVTGIYEREVSVRFVLIGNNDQLIFTNAGSDPWSNTASDLNNVTTQINSRIGSGNYDVGHLVGTGGGGVAGLGVICTSSKGRGLTGSSSPVGDGFDVDYVAHEMGHQFGGNHTFNGSGGNCSGGNRNGSTAYEPGSGITIQAYAGICAGDNLQRNSDDYFHRVSLNEIIAHTTSGSGGTCGTLASTGNAVPTVTAPAEHEVPAGTPFELEAVGSDGDGDALTYVWEQFDLGAANATGSLVDNGSRALFRSFAPTREPTRTFPSLRYILANANVPPATAPLPGTTTPSFFTGELLPSLNRNMQFRVTVRDNRAGGGGTNEATTIVDIEPAAGPFRVTAPETAVTWAAGSTQTVTWDVANTTAAPVSTSQVRIQLSLDGGYTWPVELAAAEANDGSATVLIPAGTPSTARARIKVKAVGNIFFDISGTDFSITGTNTPPTIGTVTGVTTRQGSPSATAQVTTVSDAQDAAGTLAVSVADVPDELDVSVSNSNGNVSLTATASCLLVAPTSGTRTYPVRLQVTDSGNAMSSAFVNVDVGANLAPTIGTYTGLAVARSTTTAFAPSAAISDPNGNFDEVTVSPTTLPGGGTIAVANDGTVSVTTTAGTTLGTYPVRVQVLDECGAAEIRQFDVTVATNEAVLEVASSQVVTGNGLIEPDECNQVSVTLANVGTVPATGVSATLSSANPNVTVTQGTATFPDIPAGQSRTTIVPFEVSTGGALACYSSIALNFSASYGGGSAPLNQTLNFTVGQPAATNYAFTASTGATIPSGGTAISGSNVDDGLVTVTVPFAFSLYGTNYPASTALRASSNGNLQFVASGGSRQYTNGSLPNDGSGDYAGESFPAAAPVLMPFWTDLRLDTSGGGIYTYTAGSTPTRTFTIVWRGQQYASSPSGQTAEFAVVLNEGSNVFEFLYTQTAAGAAANGAASTIGVQGASTGTVFTQYSLNQASVTPGTRLVATLPAAVCNPGGGSCATGPQVIVAQSGGNTAVTEGGNTDSYTLVLSQVPSSDVLITPTGDADVQVSSALTFTPLNWNVPQTVTVTALDDRIVEGTHAAAVSHAISGGGYDSVTVANVAVSVTDNDAASYRFATASQSGGEAAGVIDVAVQLVFATSGSGTDALESAITVPFTIGGASTASSPADYSIATSSVTIPVDGAAQDIQVAVVDDAVVEGNETIVLQLGNESGGSAAQQAVVTLGSPATHTLTITDNDVGDLTLVQSGGGTAVTEGGSGDSYTVALARQPSGNVSVTVTPDAQLQATPSTLNFTPANWNVAQTVNVSAVDDAAVEGEHSGLITHTASGGGYSGIPSVSLSVTIADNDSNEADLAVSVTRQKGPVVPGGTIHFEVAVANLSSTVDVAAASFEFAFTPGLADVEWTCSADPGATCPPSGTGEPSHAVSLDRDSGVLYLISGQVAEDAEQGSTITADASISATAPAVDPNDANDTDQASATVDGFEVFSDGFESP